jgi:hypothetical protein
MEDKAMKVQSRILLTLGVFAGSFLLFTGVKHCRSAMRRWTAEDGNERRGTCCPPAAGATEGHGERYTSPSEASEEKPRRSPSALGSPDTRGTVRP